MKLRFTNQEQIDESTFEDVEHEINIHDWDIAFIIDSEENHHSVIDLMTQGFEFTVYE